MTAEPRLIFKNNLDYYMQRNGISQRELAFAIGVHPSMVNFWVNGVNCPRMDKLQKIAKYFGIEVTDLLSEKIEISTDDEILLNKIKKLNRQQLKHLNAYIDLLLSEQEGD